MLVKLSIDLMSTTGDALVSASALREEEGNLLASVTYGIRPVCAVGRVGRHTLHTAAWLRSCMYFDFLVSALVFVLVLFIVYCSAQRKIIPHFGDLISVLTFQLEQSYPM